jgi:phage host-nuclease inhibitor protein Gam
VKPVGKLTFKAIIAGLQKLGDALARKYLRTKVELDKDALLATGRLLESPDEGVRASAEAELAQVGVEIVQAESFYLDPPREGQPDATISRPVA